MGRRDPGRHSIQLIYGPNPATISAKQQTPAIELAMRNLDLSYSALQRESNGEALDVLPERTSMFSFRGRSFSFRAEPGDRGWDAADEYVLSYLEDPSSKLRVRAEDRQASDRTHHGDVASSQYSRAAEGRTLLINDRGAVTVALAGRPRDVWSDSFLVREAIRRNLEWNKVSVDEATLLGADSFGFGDSASDGEPRLPWSYDLVVLRVPRERDLLRCQLQVLRPFLNANARVIAFGMTKHMFPDVREMLTAAIGPTRVTAVLKHAVLLIADTDRGTAPDDNSHLDLPPMFRSFPVELPGGVAVIFTLPGTFSHGELDVGTRFLLQHLSTPGLDATVVDLGCGSGVLGLALLRLEPRIALHLVDESKLALLSAQRTFGENRVPHAAEKSTQDDFGRPIVSEPHFHFEDGLRSFEDASVDLIVSNPPFHRRGEFDPHQTRRLLGQAHRVLRSAGELRIVAVHGARVEPELRALFARTERIVSNDRFAVFSCIR